MKKFAVALLFAAVFATIFASSSNAWLTPGYWKNHPEAWPVDEITLGGVTYTKAEAIDILKTPPSGGDATYILAHALIAFKLNVLNGGYNGDCAALIAEGDALLTTYPLGSNPGKPQRGDLIDLAELLDDINNDIIPCP